MPLAVTINNMTDTLATFAEQVTSVAREVGVEGRLGGQANVPGAAGTWGDLTGNVNLLGANLTTQVRAIAEVATAVTKGDLTRSIQVEARGEVAELKDNINTMIDNLRLTTERNTEQDWLKTNLARFTNMLQGQRDLRTVGQMLLSELSPLVEAQHGACCTSGPAEGRPLDQPAVLRLLASYADHPTAGYPAGTGDGPGPRRPMCSRCPLQHCADGTAIGRHADPVPAFSRSRRKMRLCYPVLFEGQVKAVIELAAFSAFTDLQLFFDLEQLTASIGIVLVNIDRGDDADQREQLLTQSPTARHRTADPSSVNCSRPTTSLSRSAAVRRTQRRGGGEEPGNRAGPACAGGKRPPNWR